MLGKAPTRIMWALPWAHPEIVVASQSKNASRDRLFTLVASNYHGEDAGGIFLLVFLALGLAGERAHAIHVGGGIWLRLQYNSGISFSFNHSRTILTTILTVVVALVVVGVGLRADRKSVV